jgi:hypothetical protein
MYLPGLPRLVAFVSVTSVLASLVTGCGTDANGTEDAAGPEADGGADAALDATVDATTDATADATADAVTADATTDATDATADTAADTAPDVTADTGPDGADAGCTSSSACQSSNQCVTGTCNTSTGTCVFANSTADSVCSTFLGSQAGFCDGAGNCVQCTKASECPGTTTDCEAPACTTNACTMNDTAAGTPTTTNPPQVPGDCQTIECNGAGGTMSVADNADVPPNTASGCQIGACTNGAPSYSSASNGAACGSGLACINGACTGCTMNSECQPPSYDTCGGGGTPNTCGCTATTCVALGVTCGTAPNGCGGTLPCNTGTKEGNETDVDCGGNPAMCATRCAQGKMCNVTSDCQSGLSCADGVCCNAACTGTCYACTAALTGLASGVCGAIKAGLPAPAGECTPSAASTCGDEGAVCNGSGACQTWPNGTQCLAPTCSGNALSPAGTCASGVCTSGGPINCTPYKCTSGACTTSCTFDTDCASSSYYCDSSHQCVLKLTQGTACGAADQCQTGNCVDGFCCDTACNTQCQACSNALTGDANGTCENVNPGTADPSGTCKTLAATSCGTDGLCATGGVCQFYGGSTVCVTASCSTVTNSQTTQGLCSGSGTCAGSTTSSCAPYVCGATASCLTSCPSNDAIGDGSCAAGDWCNGTTCVATQGSTSPCTRASQCTSHVCSGNDAGANDAGTDDAGADDAGTMTCN